MSKKRATKKKAAPARTRTAVEAMNASEQQRVQDALLAAEKEARIRQTLRPMVESIVSDIAKEAQARWAEQNAAKAADAPRAVDSIRNLSGAPAPSVNVHGHIEDLHRAVQALEEELDILRNRLAPVLAEPAPLTAVAAPGMPADCEVSARVGGIASHVASLRVQVSSITSRLQV